MPSQHLHRPLTYKLTDNEKYFSLFFENGCIRNIAKSTGVSRNIVDFDIYPFLYNIFLMLWFTMYPSFMPESIGLCAGSCLVRN